MFAFLIGMLIGVWLLLVLVMARVMGANKKKSPYE